MDKFKAAIKFRLFALISLSVFIAIVFITMNCLQTKGIIRMVGNDSLSQFIEGMQFGVFLFIQLYLFRKIARYSRAIRNNEHLKLLYIERNDERKKFIYTQIGGIGINITIGSIALGIMIAGFINVTVFITLLCTLIFIAIIKGSLKLYYNRKV